MDTGVGGNAGPFFLGKENNFAIGGFIHGQRVTERMGQHYFLERIKTMITETSTPADVRAEVLNTLRTRREKIVALAPTGYVHGFRFGSYWAEGSTTFTGLENATVVPAWESRTFQNKAGDITECVHMNVAKMLALRSIDKAIETVDTMNFG